MQPKHVINILSNLVTKMSPGFVKKILSNLAIHASSNIVIKMPANLVIKMPSNIVNKITPNLYGVAVLIILLCGIQSLQARPASDYLPSEAPALSLFFQSLTDTSGEFSGPDVTMSLISIHTDTTEIKQYTFQRFEDGLESDLMVTTLYSHADTLYTYAEDWFRIEFLDSLLFGIDSGLRMDLMRLTARPNDEWVLKEYLFPVPVTDAILDEIPSAISIKDTMNISLKIKNKRLDDSAVTTPFGELETVVFKPSIDLDLVLFVRTPFATLPVTLNILNSYGAEIHFSPGYGIVKETVEPEVLRLRNSTLGIDMEVGSLPGRVLLLQSFSIESTVNVESFPEDTESSLPKSLVLHPAYPNPFNPSTTLNFDLPEPGIIDIRIYEVTGRLIDSPVQSRFFGAGNHTVSYHAGRMSSGTYLYTIGYTSDISGMSATQSGLVTLVK